MHQEPNTISSTEHEWASVYDMAWAMTMAKSIQVVCATIFIHSYVSGFEEEKEYIWARRWSWGKFMYFLTRFAGLFFLAFVCIADIDFPWNGSATLPIDTNYSPDPAKLKGYIFIGPGAIAMIITEVVLQMRVYALYQCKKWVLALMICLSIILTFVTIAQYTALPFLMTMLICIGEGCDPGTIVLDWPRRIDFSPSCAMSSMKMSMFSWLTILLVESILFGMVLLKAIQERRNGNLVSAMTGKSSITTIMARDSTYYFAVIFISSALGTCLTFLAQTKSLHNANAILIMMSQSNSYQTIVVTTMTILAPRMLISLRREYYREFSEKESSTLAQPVFQRHSSAKRHKGKDVEKGKANETSEVDDIPQTLLYSDIATSNQSQVLEKDTISDPANGAEFGKPDVRIDDLF